MTMKDDFAAKPGDFDYEPEKVDDGGFQTFCCQDEYKDDSDNDSYDDEDDDWKYEHEAEEDMNSKQGKLFNEGDVR